MSEISKIYLNEKEAKIFWNWIFDNRTKCSDLTQKDMEDYFYNEWEILNEK